MRTAAQMQTADLPVRCRCGRVRGAVRGLSGSRGNRVVCYCDDCQVFAHFLGRAEEILDAHGGTEVFQTSPARLELPTGKEALACVRLTPKGILRWYAGCCCTPIANTLPTRRIPYVSLIHSCLDAGTGSRDAALGPVRGRVQARFASRRPAGPDVYDGVPVAMLLRAGGAVLAAGLRGDHRRSPLFDQSTGHPIAAPRVLAEHELAAYRSGSSSTS